MGRRREGKRLQNRVALITGAGRGIGKAIAMGYASEGASLALVSRTISELEDTADQARGMGADAITVVADVSKQDDVSAMAAQVLERFSKIDVLVNNAAVVGPVAPLEETDPEAWIQAINVNLIGPYLCCRAVLPSMRAQGYGRIVNVTSGRADHGTPINSSIRHLNAYMSSKAALIDLTERLAQQLEGTNVQANCLHPGGNTRLLDELIQAVSVTDPSLAGHAQRIVDEGDELMARSVEMAVFLACRESDGFTGRLIWCRDDLNDIKANLPELIASPDAYRLRRWVGPTARLRG